MAVISPHCIFLWRRFHIVVGLQCFPSAVCGALALLVCFHRAVVFVSNDVDIIYVYVVCDVYQVKVIGTSRTGN